MKFHSLWVLLLASVVGCVSVDREALEARASLDSADSSNAVKWSEDLANESRYSKNLGLVEAGRVRLLRGETAAAERYFRLAVDSAVDRKESSPQIKLGDVGNALLASTITDDRTREYYLAPYEINLALEYGILAQLANGRREDALADARLAVYLQDSLAKTYGADIAKQSGEDGDSKANRAADGVYADEHAQMAALMEGTRNSWENPLLWWLTGVLFEDDGDLDMAWQSYRKAHAVKGDNAVFASDATRADIEVKMPQKDKARLVVIYEEGFVPMREALKVPVPIYTGMSVDLPVYRSDAYRPSSVSISGAERLVAAAPAVNVRALAARDLDEHLPGIILRNITRAAVQAGAQAAVNANGNEYAQIAMFVGNAVISALRSADTRSWITLPDGQQVWQDTAMSPGEYRLGVFANGRTVNVPVSLEAGKTRIVWVADTGVNFHYLIVK